MDLLRAFVGLPLPDSFQEALLGLRRDLGPLLPGRAGFTRPGAWHLTLAFLGDIPARGPGGPDDVAGALGAITWRPFVLAPRGGGVFPDLARARVLYVGIGAGREECVALAGKVRAALSPLGYPPDRRGFSPHLTVARPRPGGPGGLAGLRAALALLEAMTWPEATVERMVVWRSDLGAGPGGGPRYTPLAECPAW